MHLLTYTDKDGFVPGQLFSPATDSSSSIQHVKALLYSQSNERNSHKKRQDGRSGGSSGGDPSGGGQADSGNDASGDPVTARLRRENNCKTVHMACVDTTQEILTQMRQNFLRCLCVLSTRAAVCGSHATDGKPIHTLTGATQHPSRADPKNADASATFRWTYRFSTASGQVIWYTLSNASQVVNRDMARAAVELAEVEREITSYLT